MSRLRKRSVITKSLAKFKHAATTLDLRTWLSSLISRWSGLSMTFLGDLQVSFLFVMDFSTLLPDNLIWCSFSRWKEESTCRACQPWAPRLGENLPHVDSPWGMVGSLFSFKRHCYLSICRYLTSFLVVAIISTVIQSCRLSKARRCMRGSKHSGWM